MKAAPKYLTGAAGAARRVEITARWSDREVSIMVADDGIGFRPEILETIGEPYVTTREKGTGLGLAIVKRVMEDHGGELVLSDAGSGAGARILLRLPISGGVASPMTAKQESV